MTDALVENVYVPGAPDVERGIFFSSSGGEIRNNRITTDRFDGISVSPGDGLSLLIVNNTLTRADAYPNTGGISILGTTQDASGIRVHNNIVYGPADPRWDTLCGLRSSVAIGSASHNFYDAEYPVCDMAVLDANDVVGTIALDAELRITTTSDAAGAGLSTVAPPTDFEGDARPSGGGVDIGADEVAE